MKISFFHPFCLAPLIDQKTALSIPNCLNQIRFIVSLQRTNCLLFHSDWFHHQYIASLNSNHGTEKFSSTTIMWLAQQYKQVFQGRMVIPTDASAHLTPLGLCSTTCYLLACFNCLSKQTFVFLFEFLIIISINLLFHFTSLWYKPLLD